MKKVDLYHSLHSGNTVEIAFKGLEISLSLCSFEATKSLISDAKAAVLKMQFVYESLRSTSEKKEFRSAAKNHKQKIGPIITKLLELSAINNMANPVVSVSRSKIKFFDGFEIEEEKISPKSFWKMYQLFRYLEICKNSNETSAVLRVISTIFSVCKDFRLSGPEQDADTLQQLKEIQGGVGVSSEVNYDSEIRATLDLITVGIKDPKAVKDYPQLARFSAAVKLAVEEYEGFQLRPENLKLTNASTGTMLVGSGTIPGGIASMFEGEIDRGYDYRPFDRITGYTVTVPEINPSSHLIKSMRNKSLSVEQQKDAMRLIHILSNTYHDRLTFTEFHRKKIFRKLIADCTFNQTKGRNSILSWMRDRSVRAIYSLDLHACSNTLSLEYQELVTEYMYTWFGFSGTELNVLMECWSRIMKFESTIVLPHSKKKLKYKFKSGQPMGFTDSFFSFAMLHHIAVLTIVRLNPDLICVGYHIVGDDSVIAFKSDPQMKYVKGYKDIMAFLNTECHLHKGYIFNLDASGYEQRIAEFCKFLLCEGQDITPLPWNLLCKSEGFAGKLLLIGWVSTHSPGLRLTPEFISKVIGLGAEVDITMALLSRVPIKNLMNSEKGPFQMKKVFDKNDTRIIFAASLALLKQSITIDILLEKNREPDYSPKYSDIRSFDNRKLRSAIEVCLKSNSTSMLQNKFVVWFKNLELKALAQGIAVDNMLEGILPGVDILEILPVLKGWDTSDFTLITSLAAFWSNLSQEERVEGESYLDIYLDEELFTHLSMLERLSYNDLDSQNHRFGSKPERIFSGFDHVKFLEETLEFSRKLNVTNKDVELFLEKNNEEFCSEFGSEPQELWKAAYIDHAAEFEPEPEISPWDLIG